MSEARSQDSLAKNQLYRQQEALWGNADVLAKGTNRAGGRDASN